MDVLFQGPGNAAAGIDVVQVSVEEHFQEHPWVVAARAPAFIGGYDAVDVELIDHPVHEPHRVAFRDAVSDALGEQDHLVARLLLENNVAPFHAY
ncbi:hypothetical protein POKO110462_03985 [Pontibacter korlensis]